MKKTFRTNPPYVFFKIIVLTKWFFWYFLTTWNSTIRPPLIILSTLQKCLHHVRTLFNCLGTISCKKSHCEMMIKYEEQWIVIETCSWNLRQWNVFTWGTFRQFLQIRSSLIAYVNYIEEHFNAHYNWKLDNLIKSFIYFWWNAVSNKIEI